MKSKLMTAMLTIGSMGLISQGADGHVSAGVLDAPKYLSSTDQNFTLLKAFHKCGMSLMDATARVTGQARALTVDGQVILLLNSDFPVLAKESDDNILLVPQFPLAEAASGRAKYLQPQDLGDRETLKSFVYKGISSEGETSYIHFVFSKKDDIKRDFGDKAAAAMMLAARLIGGMALHNTLSDKSSDVDLFTKVFKYGVSKSQGNEASSWLSLFKTAEVKKQCADLALAIDDIRQHTILAYRDEGVQAEPLNQLAGFVGFLLRSR